MNRFSIQHLLLLSLWFPISARLSAAEPPARFEFTRMIAHWDAYGDDKNYLSFVDECQPEVAQVGFYGAHFWSLGHTDQYGGYPSHLPVKGLKECGDWFERIERLETHAWLVVQDNIRLLNPTPSISEVSLSDYLERLPASPEMSRASVLDLGRAFNVPPYLLSDALRAIE